MKILYAVLLIARVAPVVLAQERAPATAAAIYEIPPFHSQVQFTVPFMGLASVKGAFEDFQGALFLHPSRPESSSVTFVIRTESIHTGIAMRDKHLRSTDFFDVGRYPVIVYRSDRIERAGKDFVARGSLTMHGVTRPVVVPIRMRHPPVHDADGLDYVGFDADLLLNWRDFQIAATNANNSWFQPATMLVNDSVRVELSLEAEHRALPALDALRRARAANPESSHAEAMLGIGLLTDGQRAAAVESFRRALALDATDALALEMLRRSDRP